MSLSCSQRTHILMSTREIRCVKGLGVHTLHRNQIIIVSFVRWSKKKITRQDGNTALICSISMGRRSCFQTLMSLQAVKVDARNQVLDHT